MTHEGPETGNPGQNGPVTGGTAAAGAQKEREAGQRARRRRRRPALLARFPRLRPWPPADQEWPEDSPLLRRKDLEDYPALAGDLRVWLDRVEPRFRSLDHRARILQNQFWRQHVTLIAGGLVATSLGAVQAAMGGGVAGLAVAQALLTGILAGLTVLIRSRRAQRGYLTARLRAEQIKSEFFLFLAGVGGYGTGADPAARLMQQVADIENAEDAT